MKLFSINLAGYREERLTQLYDLLKNAVNRLHKSKLECKIVQSAVMCVATESFKEDEMQQLYATAAETMAEFVIQYLQEDLLAEWIQKDCQTLDQREKAKLQSFCTALLDDSEFEEEIYAEENRNKKELKNSFYEYFQTSEELHLQGFIRFRLKSYVDDLRSFLDYALEEFVIDRQYQEFIALLKYFVCEQEARRPAVHIYHQKGNEFIVLDEKYRPIETNDADGLVVETIDKEINLEDMIISTLITVSPKMVYIHTKEPDMQVIRTIKLIFEERAVLCP